MLIHYLNKIYYLESPIGQENNNAIHRWTIFGIKIIPIDHKNYKEEHNINKIKHIHSGLIMVINCLNNKIFYYKLFHI